jgi:8-oxo-dGTP diphosphatase
MSREGFRVVVKGMVTRGGEVLLGRKVLDEDHPIGGEWHLIGGHLERGEELEEAIRREIREEAGIAVAVDELIEASTFSWSGDGAADSIQFLFHCRHVEGEAKPCEDLDAVQWVDAEHVTEELGAVEADRIENSEPQRTFLQQLQAR